MAFIASYTAGAISNAVKNKKKYQIQIENTSQTRDVLKIIERDINKAFNYKNIHVELYNEARQKQEERSQKGKKSKQQRTPKVPPGAPPPPQDPTSLAPRKPKYQPKTQKLQTHFVGDKHSFYFTSLNNTRTEANAQISDQMEVGYFLKNCKSLGNKKITSKCLWRQSTPYIDDDPTQDGDQVVLLENIEEFDVKYFDDQKKTWVDSWNSKTSNEPSIRDHFPVAVEVLLHVRKKEGKKPRSYKYTLTAKVRHPNNPNTRNRP